MSKSFLRTKIQLSIENQKRVLEGADTCLEVLSMLLEKIDFTPELHMFASSLTTGMDEARNEGCVHGIKTEQDPEEIKKIVWNAQNAANSFSKVEAIFRENNI